MLKDVKLVGDAYNANVVARVALIFGAGLVLAIAIGSYITDRDSNLDPPTDAEIKLHFKNNRSCYLKLVEMMKEEKGIFRVAPDFTASRENDGSLRISGFNERAPVMTRKRHEEYKRLFGLCGISRGVQSFNEGNVVEFISDSSKQIEYNTLGVPKEKVYQTLDGLDPGTSTRYSRLAPDFYITLQWKEDLFGF